MSFHRLVFFVSIVLAAVQPAFADLPSLAADARQRSAVAGANGDAQWFEELRAGQLRVAFASVDYRFADAGLETQWRIAGATARAIVAYTGERRLETGWQARGGAIKFAVTSDRLSSRYRVEFVRDF